MPEPSTVMAKPKLEPRYYGHPGCTPFATAEQLSKLAETRVNSKAWTKEIISYDSPEAFSIASKIYASLGQLPLRINAPHLIDADDQTRTITTLTFNVSLYPLDERALDAQLSHQTLDHLRVNLRAYISLLYNYGIAYQVTNDNIFLIKVRTKPGAQVPKTLLADEENTEWVLFLGGMDDIEYRDPEAREADPKWQDMEDSQLFKVNELFNSLSRQVEEDVEALHS